MRAIHFFFIWLTIASVCAYIRYYFGSEEGGSNE